jgi:hypothetical protein
MFRYIFTGKVLPERVDFSLTPHQIEAITNTGQKFKISISIQKSQIFLEVNSENVIDDIFTLRNTIVDFVRQYTDIFGYLHGYAYDLEITSLIFPDNEHLIFGVSITEIEKDAVNRPIQDLQKIFEMEQDPDNLALRLALMDLNLSIKYPKDTGVFCYRAIESIMQFFNKGNPEDVDARKKAWTALSENLRISKPWTDFVKDFALNPRHGSPKLLTGEDRINIMMHSWQVVDRFLIFLTNGRKQLDSSYPQL